MERPFGLFAAPWRMLGNRTAPLGGCSEGRVPPVAVLRERQGPALRRWTSLKSRRTGSGLTGVRRARLRKAGSVAAPSLTAPGTVARRGSRRRFRGTVRPLVRRRGGARGGGLQERSMEHAAGSLVGRPGRCRWEETAVGDGLPPPSPGPGRAPRSADRDGRGGSPSRCSRVRFDRQELGGGGRRPGGSQRPDGPRRPGDPRHPSDPRRSDGSQRADGLRRAGGGRDVRVGRGAWAAG
ncbi:hypothetical protein SAMN04489716_0321 [Actinoplanes derwentensis]|uniref:Uncharacterized protein n=1 Tax=Actinoplanes derwentensis TaxID=113562 RepID=A0A1H1QJ67_9ACTN|nr:hypothetical protein SAMN04489716_0321 [Actinoplanes derwentensis]